MIKKTSIILFLPLLFVHCTRGNDASNDVSSPSSSSSPVEERQREAENKPSSHPTSPIRHLTSAEFKQKVGRVVNGKPSFVNTKPVLIDFYADWCRPCHAMAPLLEELAERYGSQIDCYKVDVETEMELSNEWKVNVLPSFLIVDRQGHMVRLVGMQSQSALEGHINASLR